MYSKDQFTLLHTALTIAAFAEVDSPVQAAAAVSMDAKLMTCDGAVPDFLGSSISLSDDTARDGAMGSPSRSAK